jgi:hypothetical protein
MDVSKWYKKLEMKEAWTTAEMKEWQSDMKEKKKEFKKLIKREFEDIRERYGFCRRSDTLLLKVTDQNILHIINFDLAKMDFKCTVAIQPLYMYDYTHRISLNMGDNLNRLNRSLPDWIDYEPTEENLKQTRKLLLEKGIPWLERYGSPEGIIDFVLRDRNTEFWFYSFFGFNTFFQKQYLAFSLLYTGCISEGLKYLEELTEEIKEDAVDYMKKYKNELLNMVDLLRKDPGKTQELLEQFITEYKEALKILK